MDWICSVFWLFNRFCRVLTIAANRKRPDSEHDVFLCLLLIFGTNRTRWKSGLMRLTEPIQNESEIFQQHSSPAGAGAAFIIPDQQNADVTFVMRNWRILKSLTAKPRQNHVATVLPVLPFCLQDTLLSNNLDFHSSLASMFLLLLIETQTPAHDLLQAEWLFSFIGHTLLASLATLSGNDWFHLAEQSITPQWGSCWASGAANCRLFLHSWNLQRFLYHHSRRRNRRGARGWSS